MYDIIYIYLEDLLAFPNLSAFPGTRSANEQGLLLMCLGACLCSEILYLCCEILQSKMSLHYYNARLLRFCWPRTLPQPLVRINTFLRWGRLRGGLVEKIGPSERPAKRNLSHCVGLRSDKIMKWFFTNADFDDLGAMHGKKMRNLELYGRGRGDTVALLSSRTCL